MSAGISYADMSIRMVRRLHFPSRRPRPSFAIIIAILLFFSRNAKIISQIKSSFVALEVLPLDLPKLSLPANEINEDGANNSDKGIEQGSPNRATNNTKIVAVTNFAYEEIALVWYERMTMLGYTTHVVATVDQEAHSFLDERGVRVDTLLPIKSGNWPLSLGKAQQNRRKIFGTRWVYVLAQLRSGHNVLLTDADNIFVRYMPMEDLESSEYDVYHAYAGDFPIRFLSMGFTVCGGMAWFRASSSTIRYVESVLEQCGWSGDVNTGAMCDDQQVVNKMFFFNTLNYTFHGEGPSSINSTFWKDSLEGESQVTRHKFKIWDVDTAYRGPIDGKGGICPKNNWVAMPLNSFDDPENSVRKGDIAGERKLRLPQWMKYCKGEANYVTGAINGTTEKQTTT